MKYIFTFLLLTTSLSLSAQSFFLEQLSRETFLEQNEKYQLFADMEADARYVDASPVKMNNLWDFQNAEGVLKFMLPGIPESIRAYAINPRRYSDDHYTWTGQIVDTQGQITGTAMFARKGDQNFGTITMAGRRWRIRDLDAGVDEDQVLIEFSPDYLTEISCGVISSAEDTTDHSEDGKEEEEEGDTKPTDSNEPQARCNAHIRVLFLYTQEVLDDNLSPEAIATNGIMAMNTALTVSEIPDANVSFSDVAIVLLESYVDDEINAGDAERIVNTLLRNNIEVQTLRDQYNADVVVLMQTTDIYVLDDFVENDSPSGFAHINESVNINRVYAVVEALDAFVDPELLVHEMGHLLGGRHEDDSHPYAKAHNICINPGMFNDCPTTLNPYTVMRSTLATNNVIRFSNPDVTYMGAATGSETTNNARMIGETACGISLFGGQVEGDYEDPPFSAFISGPIEVYHEEGVTFDYSSYTQGCAYGEVSYHWEISWDHMNTFDHLSFDEDMVLDADHIPTHEPRGFIRLTASCSEEPQISDPPQFLEIRNWTAENRPAPVGDVIAPFSPTKEIDQQNNTSGLSIYPNPAQQQLQLDWPDYKDGLVIVKLISAQGAEHLLHQSHAKPRTLDVTPFPAGWYWLEVQTAEQQFRSPLILTKS